MSTCFGDRRIPFVPASCPGARSAPVRGPRCRGCGFYHHRASSQPLHVDSSTAPGGTASGCCCPPAGPSSGARLLPPPRLESTSSVTPRISSVRPGRPAEISPPFEGARLLPPPRPGSTTFVSPLVPPVRRSGARHPLDGQGAVSSAMRPARQILLIGGTGPIPVPQDLSTGFKGVNPLATWGFSPAIFTGWTPGEGPARPPHASRPALGFCSSG